jgi:hypothetical protein
MTNMPIIQITEAASGIMCVISSLSTSRNHQCAHLVCWFTRSSIVDHFGAEFAVSMSGSAEMFVTA